MKNIFKTERLTLRRFTINDTAFILKLVNSPGWIEFIGDRNIKTEEDATDYLLNGPIKSYQENGFGLSLVELIHDKTPIGMCGLIKRDYLDNPDIGFAFLPEFTGNGYAYEIAKATVNYAEIVLKLERIMAITTASNRNSIRLLEGIGLKFIKNITPPAETEELMLFSN